MIGHDSGQLPSVLAQGVQLLLVGRFLLRQIAREQFVLPHGLIADVDHRRDRRGRRARIDLWFMIASSHNQHTAVGGSQPQNKVNYISKAQYLLRIICSLPQELA